MELLFAGGAETAISSHSAACLLIFSLLYTPCVAAVASVRREMGGKWAVIVVVWQCVVAWVAACIAHLIGILL
jgi:ferrous iron transport protein B